jgi:hypothetical protein
LFSRHERSRACQFYFCFLFHIGQKLCFRATNGLHHASSSFVFFPIPRYRSNTQY